jgi:hypothetical protein
VSGSETQALLVGYIFRIDETDWVPGVQDLDFNARRAERGQANCETDPRVQRDDMNVNQITD